MDLGLEGPQARRLKGLGGLPVTVTYSQAPNKLVIAANEFDYAYREIGEGAVPLVLFQPFPWNLDNWAPR